MQYTIQKYTTLTEAIADIKDQIDIAAGQARRRYITTVEGQSETYMMKAADADRYKADGYPVDASNYPWILRDSIRRGVSAQQSADDIIAVRDQWLLVGGAIEDDRLLGKESLDALAIDATIAEAIQIGKTAIAALNIY